MAVKMIEALADARTKAKQMLFDGSWVGSVSGKEISVESAGNRQMIGSVLRGGAIKQSRIGHEFSLEGMFDSFTQEKNVTVNLNTPSH